MDSDVNAIRKIIVIVDDINSIDVAIANEKEPDKKFYVTREYIESARKAFNKEAQRLFDEAIEKLERIRTYLIYDSKYCTDIKMLDGISENSLDEQAVNKMEFSKGMNLKTFMSGEYQNFILELIKKLKDEKAVIALWEKIDDIAKDSIDFRTLISDEYQKLLKQIFNRLKNDEAKIAFCASYERQKKDVVKRSIESGENRNEETDRENIRNPFYGLGVAKNSKEGSLGEDIAEKYLIYYDFDTHNYEMYRNTAVMEDEKAINTAIAGEKELNTTFYITEELIERAKEAFNEETQRLFPNIKKPYLYYKSKPIYDKNSLGVIFKNYIDANDVESITFPGNFNFLRFCDSRTIDFYKEFMRYLEDVDAQIAFCKKFEECKINIVRYNTGLAKNRNPKTDKANKGNFFYGLGIASNSKPGSLGGYFISEYMEPIGGKVKISVVDDPKKLNNNSSKLDFVFLISAENLETMKRAINSDSKEKFEEAAEKYEELESHLKWDPRGHTYKEFKNKFKEVKDPVRVTRKACEFLNDLFGEGGKHWLRTVMNKIDQMSAADNYEKEKILEKAGRCIIFLLTRLDEKILSDEEKSAIVAYMQNVIPNFKKDKLNAIFAIFLAIWQVIKGFFTFGRSVIVNPVYSAFASVESNAFKNIMKLVKKYLNDLKLYELGFELKSRSKSRSKSEEEIFPKMIGQDSKNGMENRWPEIN